MTKQQKDTMYKRSLTPDVEIPLLGYGTFLIPDGETPAAVETALREGYRHIDTAEVYENERGVGEGIKRGLTQQGLAREDVFVTTKLWPLKTEASKTTEETIESLAASLERLALDYVDLYLIHAPNAPDQRVAQWRGLVELQRSGGARSIGVSNFNIGHIEELVAAGLPLPAANQIELHPWSQKPALVTYLEEKGIVPIAYSSLVPLSTWRTAPGHDSGKTEAMRLEGELGDSPFKTMAEKYGVTEAQLLLRWGVQKGYPVLPKSTDMHRIRANAAIFSFRIDDSDMVAIGTMDRGDGIAWGVDDPTRAS